MARVLLRLKSFVLISLVLVSMVLTQLSTAAFAGPEHSPGDQDPYITQFMTMAATEIYSHGFQTVSPGVLEASQNLMTLALLVQSLEVVGHVKYKKSTLKRSRALEYMAADNPSVAGDALTPAIQSLMRVYLETAPVERNDAFSEVLRVAEALQPTLKFPLLEQAFNRIKVEQLFTKILFVLTQSVDSSHSFSQSTVNVIFEKIGYLARTSNRVATYGALLKTDPIWQSYLEFVALTQRHAEEDFRKISPKLQNILVLLDQVTIEYFFSKVERRPLSKKFESLMEVLQALSGREWSEVHAFFNGKVVPLQNGAQVLDQYWISRQQLRNFDEVRRERILSQSYYERFWKFIGEISSKLKNPGRASVVDWLTAPLDFYTRPNGTKIASLVAWDRGFEFPVHHLDYLQSSIAEGHQGKCESLLSQIEVSRAQPSGRLTKALLFQLRNLRFRE